MSIYVGDKKAKLYHGDYGPAQLYRGDVKIAGYTDVEKVGASISGVDTYNDQLNPTIEGKSKQAVAVPGKNLFDKMIYKGIVTYTADGFTYTTNEMNKINAILIPINFKDNTQYTLSCDAKETVPTGNAIIYVEFTNGEYQYVAVIKGTTMTHYAASTLLGRTVKSIVLSYATLGVAEEITINHFQIEEGTVETPYEPFVPISPSPDYPSSIRSSENFDVVSCGRNVLDVYKWQNRNGVVPIDNVITQTFTSGALFLNNTRVQTKLKPNQTYSIVVSILKSDMIGPIDGVRIWGYDAKGVETQHGNVPAVIGSVGIFQFTAPPDGSYAIALGGGQVTFTVALQIMILEGTYTIATLPPYQPYHATTAHVTDPLRSVGNVSDSIEVSDGKVEMVRRVARVTLTSSNWIREYTQFYHDGYTHFQFESPQGRVKATCLCNILPFVGNSWVTPTAGVSCSAYFFYPTFANVALGISDTDTPAQKASKLKSWLTTHEMYVDVLPDIPTRTDITATPLGQAMLALRTTPGHTQVFTNSAVPPVLRVKIKEML